MIYDVCIVGSGAGGGPIAYELSNAGFNVVVLEKGNLITDDDISKDELGVVRREKFKPRLEDEQHVIMQRNADGSISRFEGKDHDWSFWNGSAVGGSSNFMSGYFHRLKPHDFKLQSLFDEVEGANIVDWPITYEELEPYYDKVEKVIGVSGANKMYKFQEPRSSGFIYKKLQESGVSQWFDDACEKLGYESFPTPRAILSEDALGRKGCSYSNFCGSYLCATDAKGSSRAALLNKCQATIVPNAFVYKLYSDANKITKLSYYDFKKNSHDVQAKIFVIAAQAIETSRLLLNSKNKFFPHGIANNAHQVGKNLIFSGGGVGWGRFYLDDLTQAQQEALMQPGVFFNRSLQQWYEYYDGCSKYKGGTIDFLFEHANIIARAARQISHNDDEVIWGEALKEKIYQKVARSRVVQFEVFNDWLPTDHCFVSVDESTKDKYGVNVGVIHLWGHPHDVLIGEFLAKKAAKVLKKMGAKEVEYDISSAPPQNLVAGGCRFGDDPKNSVLDKNCKAHELDNLYVSDASFMPTGGSVPYTWTIYANSFRVADEIKKKLRDSFVS